MLKRNIYYPDTCGCAYEFEFDDEDPQALDNWSAPVTRWVRRCPAHSSVADDGIRAAIEREVKEKNAARAALLATFPEYDSRGMAAQIADEFMQTLPSVANANALARSDAANALAEVLAASMPDRFIWSFDADRKLAVGIRGATHGPAEIARARAALGNVDLILEGPE